MKTTFLFAAAMAIFPADGLVFAQDTTLTITNSGRVGIGTTSPQSTLHVGFGDISDMPVPLKMMTVSDISASTGDNLLAATRLNQSVGMLSGSIQGFESYVKTTHGSGSIPLMIGLIGNLEQSGVGTIAEARSVTAGGVVRGSGAITTWKIFKAGVGVNGGTSVITDGYGFYMDPWATSGITVTNKWGVYINDVNATNYFGGKVGIGVTNPSNAITLPNNPNSTGQGLANSWTTYSSRRWKTNINTLDGALETVGKLRGVTYNWKKDAKRDIGLIAEEVGEVIPEVVQYEENGKDAKSVDYARLVALLIQGMKEQQKQIDELKERITVMNSKGSINVGELRK